LAGRGAVGALGHPPGPAGEPGVADPQPHGRVGLEVAVPVGGRPVAADQHDRGRARQDPEPDLDVVGPARAPARGDEPAEVVRVAGATLIHEVGGETTQHVPLHGVTIGQLAGLVGVTLDPGFSVGADTPPLEVDAPLDVDTAEAVGLGDWYDLGWRILDAVACDATAPSVLQIWPEHFDAGCS